MKLKDDYDDQMIFGDLVGLKLPDICLTGEEKPRKKKSPRKLVSTGNRTRARYRLLHSGLNIILINNRPTNMK